MARTVFEKSDAITRVAEVFRELGFEGASLYEITERTGLSKGSLYHFFPEGKESMAAEILAHVDQWFVREVFENVVPYSHTNPEDVAAIRQWGRERAVPAGSTGFADGDGAGVSRGRRVIIG